MGKADSRHGEEAAALVAHFLTGALLDHCMTVGTGPSGAADKLWPVTIGGTKRSLSRSIANVALWVYSLLIRVKVGEVPVPSIDHMYVPLHHLRSTHRSAHTFVSASTGFWWRESTRRPRLRNARR